MIVITTATRSLCDAHAMLPCREQLNQIVVLGHFYTQLEDFVDSAQDGTLSRAYSCALAHGVDGERLLHFMVFSYVSSLLLLICIF